MRTEFQCEGPLEFRVIGVKKDQLLKVRKTPKVEGWNKADTIVLKGEADHGLDGLGFQKTVDRNFSFLHHAGNVRIYFLSLSAGNQLLICQKMDVKVLGMVQSVVGVGQLGERILFGYHDEPWLRYKKLEGPLCAVQFVPISNQNRHVQLFSGQKLNQILRVIFYQCQLNIRVAAVKFRESVADHPADHTGGADDKFVSCGIYFMVESILEDVDEEIAERIVRRAIQRYGLDCGEQVRKKVETMGLPVTLKNYRLGKDLPSLGWEKESVPLEDPNAVASQVNFCPLADRWKKLGFEKWGRIYCCIDQAKYRSYSDQLTCYHDKNQLDGDSYCVVRVVSGPPQEEGR